MLKDCKVSGNVMTLTIELHAPVQSKSALDKAAKKGIPADKVPASLVATTGGFTRFGNHAISLNVLTK